MAKILHCGQNLRVETRYAVTNYPAYGDETYFDYVWCPNCKNHVHAYYYFYFQKTRQTETFISDKHTRHKFQMLIETGQAFIVPVDLNRIQRNVRAQVLAGEWTLKTMKPADVTAIYLRRNERVRWISNEAKESLRRRREAWLSSYAGKKQGKD